jgi:hypothetical protein
MAYKARGARPVALPKMEGVLWTTALGVAAGRVVGELMGDDFIGGCWTWSPASNYTLLSPPGWTCSASAINAAGDVTGWHVSNLGASLAYVWQDGVFTDLPLPRGASTGTDADTWGLAINRRGHVALFARMDDGTDHVALFDGRKSRDLGPASYDNPVAINNRDEIVGSSLSGDGWLWSHGTMSMLGDIAQGARGWSRLVPSGINDAGVIVGTGILDGIPHAFELVPTAVAPASAIVHGAPG